MIKFEDIEKIPDNFGKNTWGKFRPILDEIRQRLETRADVWFLKVTLDTKSGTTTLQNKIRKTFESKVDCYIETKTRTAIIKPNFYRNGVKI